MANKYLLEIAHDDKVCFSFEGSVIQMKLNDLKIAQQLRVGSFWQHFCV